MKTPLLRSNVSSKPSIVLVVFAAASLLAPVARAGTDFPMPPGTPVDPDPAARGSITSQFLTYGVDKDGHQPKPTKTLRITNNTERTVYPVMRDPNDPPYDPYDLPNMEYRGYIGYKVCPGGGAPCQYYFGLREHESILVRIPLVFWNGGRIAVGTDGQYLTEEGLPLSYDSNAKRSIADAETSNDTIRDGVVMWYRAGTPVDFTPDSEDQLAEWTIRDHDYLSNPDLQRASGGKIPDNQLLTLINYDVSNVDSLYLPLAMEANDSWVAPQKTVLDKASDRSKPNLTGGWMPGSHPDVFGWTGAIDPIPVLQGKIHEFTADNNTLLVQYFGGKGWPFYNIPSSIKNENAPRKIPSGANIFPQSPRKGLGDRSSYDTEKYMLSSGGTEKIAETIASSGDQSNLANNKVRLSENEPQSKIDFVKVGYIATANPPPQNPNPIPQGTTVTAVDERVVTLSQPLTAPIVGSSITFARLKQDYAAEAMIKLWYSWAQYYLMHWNDPKRTSSPPTTQTTITGSIEQNLATLSFNNKHPELVPGMAVKGPGLDDAMTEVGIHQGDAVILKIASDQKSVTLSQVANKTLKDATFTVHPPQSLLWTPTKQEDPGYPLIGDKFNFPNPPDCTPGSPNRNNAVCRHDPYDFSQQVYLIMASMNQIGHQNNDNVFKFMQDVIGGNMGFIFTNRAKNIGDAQMVIAMIRDMIKSVLRGVSDFTKYPDIVENGEHTSWYPDPKERRGGQPFNVFNLDPFVWFVHVKLGFSGYGFSLDDDKSDIGSEGQSQLQLSIGGKGGLKNAHEWSIEAPFGPVKVDGLPYSGTQTAVNYGNTDFKNIEKVSDNRNEPITITAKDKHHLSDGDTVVIDQVKGAAAAAANGTFKINNVTSYTFELFDAATGKTPIFPSGGYAGGGRWAYPPHPYIDTGADLTKVYRRVKDDDPLGTFQGALVSVKVNGVYVDRNKEKNGKKFRVWRLGLQKEGRLLLDADLTDADGKPLAPGLYDFIFFGIVEPGTGQGGPPPPKPPSLGAIREDIHDEMDRIETRLHQLEKEHSESKQSERKERWLEMRISVLTARLRYPTDEVLKQLEQQVEARDSLGRKAWRTFLDQLNTRIVELQNGG